MWSRYIMAGTETVIEDVKGVKTQAYKLKEKLMAKKGISIREI